MKIDSWLKISEKDGINLDLLKTRLVVPNPDYAQRIKMGIKPVYFNASGTCESCGRDYEVTAQYKKEVPKKCRYCHERIKPFVVETPIKRIDELYEEVGSELWVPRSLVSKYGNDSLEDKTTLGDHEVDFKSKIKLGPNSVVEDNQEQFVKELLESFQTDYGAIGQAPPGYGKTVCALETIARLKRPAAIIVHKEFLMNQWTERTREFFDITPDEVGYVQQDVCDFQGKKIVMIMLQSLLVRDYSKSLFDYFGTVCFDECHRVSAQHFRKVITMFPARYRLGVTATPRRADGLENVFFWHIGAIKAVGEARKLKPRIKIIKTEIEPTARDKRMMYDFTGKQNLNKVISYLISDDKRNRVIVGLIKKALKSGRKVMILSGRLDHLDRLNSMTKMEMLKDGIRYTSGYYVGGMTEEERTISATRQLIFATYQMSAEGLDIPELDTLFIVTPKSDIEQSVGRILRTVEGKKEPVVVDFSDPIEMCVNMLKKRVRFYRKMGFTI